MKIVTLNFNKYEILSRKNFFTTLTNEKKILMCNTIEDVVKENPNLVILKNSRIITENINTIERLSNNNIPIFLYAEEEINKLLAEKITCYQNVSTGICLEEYEIEPCRKAIQSRKIYNSVCFQNIKNRKFVKLEKQINKLSYLQFDVLYSLFREKSISEIADEQNTTVDTIRHIKKTVLNSLSEEVGADNLSNVMNLLL